ncbi:hypothetical protein BJ962_006779 [Streptomyces aureorectus]|nr:hypothetical protein [Streptomyces calvus]MBA8980190.1 hypothetical protein [Streptomyces calvus]
MRGSGAKAPRLREPVRTPAEHSTPFARRWSSPTERGKT